MPSLLDSNTSLPSSSAGFKIRRLASGLLPQQVRPDSHRQIPSDIRSNADHDARIETPVSLKESTRKSNDVLRARITTSYSTPKFPAHGTPIDHYQRFLDGDRDLIQNDKLIEDHNEIGMSSAQRLADRNLDPEFFEKHIMNQPDINRIINEPDIEFDPSDREISDTSPSTHREERINARANTFLDRSPPKADPNNHLTALTRTPRRRSPLRQVIGISSSVKSVAEEIAEEIAQSGATKSKTTKEILEQINSSVERLREKDNSFMETLGAEEDSEDEKEILKSLDEFLPKETYTEPPLSFSGNFTRTSEVRNETMPPINQFETLKPRYLSPSLESTGHRSAFEGNANIASDGPLRLTKRNATKPCRKLSGKYARDVLRKRKLKRTGPYRDWSKENWAKLKRLIELSIPREILVNSKLVTQDLQCGKKELADRISFLENCKRP